MSGVTRPVFVTGAGGQLSPYDNPASVLDEWRKSPEIQDREERLLM